jgi:hypothetical protein
MRVIEIGQNILGVSINKNFPSVNTTNEAALVLNQLQNNDTQISILNSYTK